MSDDLSEFLKGVKERPDKFIQKVISRLNELDIYEPSDLADVDEHKFESELTEAGAKQGEISFLKEAIRKAKSSSAPAPPPIPHAPPPPDGHSRGCAPRNINSAGGGGGRVTPRKLPSLSSEEPGGNAAGKSRASRQGTKDSTDGGHGRKAPKSRGSVQEDVEEGYPHRKAPSRKPDEDEGQQAVSSKSGSGKRLLAKQVENANRAQLVLRHKTAVYAKPEEAQGEVIATLERGQEVSAADTWEEGAPATRGVWVHVQWGERPISGWVKDLRANLVQLQHGQDPEEFSSNQARGERAKVSEEVLEDRVRNAVPWLTGGEIERLQEMNADDAEYTMTMLQLNTTVMTMVKQKMVQELRWVLDKFVHLTDANIQVDPRSGLGILHVAAEVCDAEMVDLLVEFRADVFARARSNDNRNEFFLPVHKAVKAGKWRVARRLLESMEARQETLRQMAIRHPDLLWSLCKKMIDDIDSETQIDPEEFHHRSVSLQMIAQIEFKVTGKLKRDLESSKEDKASGERIFSERTPLDYAVLQEKHESVRLLVKADCTVQKLEQVMMQGRTPWGIRLQLGAQESATQVTNKVTNEVFAEQPSVLQAKAAAWDLSKGGFEKVSGSSAQAGSDSGYWWEANNRTQAFWVQYKGGKHPKYLLRTGEKFDSIVAVNANNELGVYINKVFQSCTFSRGAKVPMDEWVFVAATLSDSIGFITYYMGKTGQPVQQVGSVVLSTWAGERYSPGYNYRRRYGGGGLFGSLLGGGSLFGDRARAAAQEDSKEEDPHVIRGLGTLSSVEDAAQGPGFVSEVWVWHRSLGLSELETLRSKTRHNYVDQESLSSDKYNPLKIAQFLAKADVFHSLKCSSGAYLFDLLADIGFSDEELRVLSEVVVRATEEGQMLWKERLVRAAWQGQVNLCRFMVKTVGIRPDEKVVTSKSLFEEKVMSIFGRQEREPVETTPIAKAAESGQLETLKVLLTECDKVDLNTICAAFTMSGGQAKSVQTSTALSKAVDTLNVEAAQLLLEHEADPSQMTFSVSLNEPIEKTIKFESVASSVVEKQLQFEALKSKRDFGHVPRCEKDHFLLKMLQNNGNVKCSKCAAEPKALGTFHCGRKECKTYLCDACFFAEKHSLVWDVDFSGFQQKVLNTRFTRPEESKTALYAVWNSEDKQHSLIWCTKKRRYCICRAEDVEVNKKGEFKVLATKKDGSHFLEPGRWLEVRDGIEGDDAMKVNILKSVQGEEPAELIKVADDGRGLGAMTISRQGYAANEKAEVVITGQALLTFSTFKLDKQDALTISLSNGRREKLQGQAIPPGIELPGPTTVIEWASSGALSNGGWTAIATPFYKAGSIATNYLTLSKEESSKKHSYEVLYSSMQAKGFKTSEHVAWANLSLFTNMVTEYKQWFGDVGITGVTVEAVQSFSRLRDRWARLQALRRMALGSNAWSLAVESPDKPASNGEDLASFCKELKQDFKALMKAGQGVMLLPFGNEMYTGELAAGVFVFHVQGGKCSAAVANTHTTTVLREVKAEKVTTDFFRELVELSGNVEAGPNRAGFGVSRAEFVCLHLLLQQLEGVPDKLLGAESVEFVRPVRPLSQVSSLFSLGEFLGVQGERTSPRWYELLCSLYVTIPLCIFQGDPVNGRIAYKALKLLTRLKIFQDTVNQLASIDAALRSETKLADILSNWRAQLAQSCCKLRDVGCKVSSSFLEQLNKELESASSRVGEVALVSNVADSSSFTPQSTTVPTKFARLLEAAAHHSSLQKLWRQRKREGSMVRSGTLPSNTHEMQLLNCTNLKTRLAWFSGARNEIAQALKGGSSPLLLGRAIGTLDHFFHATLLAEAFHDELAAEIEAHPSWQKLPALAGETSINGVKRPAKPIRVLSHDRFSEAVLVGPREEAVNWGEVPYTAITWWTLDEPLQELWKPFRAALLLYAEVIRAVNKMLLDSPSMQLVGTCEASSLEARLAVICGAAFMHFDQLYRRFDAPGHDAAFFCYSLIGVTTFVKGISGGNKHLGSISMYHPEACADVGMTLSGTNPERRCFHEVCAHFASRNVFGDAAEFSQHLKKLRECGIGWEVYHAPPSSREWEDAVAPYEACLRIAQTSSSSHLVTFLKEAWEKLLVEVGQYSLQMEQESMDMSAAREEANRFMLVNGERYDNQQSMEEARKELQECESATRLARQELDRLKVVSASFEEYGEFAFKYAEVSAGVPKGWRQATKDDVGAHPEQLANQANIGPARLTNSSQIVNGQAAAVSNKEWKALTMQLLRRDIQPEFVAWTKADIEGKLPEATTRVEELDKRLAKAREEFKLFQTLASHREHEARSRSNRSRAIEEGKKLALQGEFLPPIFREVWMEAAHAALLCNAQKTVGDSIKKGMDKRPADILPVTQMLPQPKNLNIIREDVGRIWEFAGKAKLAAKVAQPAAPAPTSGSPPEVSAYPEVAGVWNSSDGNEIEISLEGEELVVEVRGWGIKRLPAMMFFDEDDGTVCLAGQSGTVGYMSIEWENGTVWTQRTGAGKDVCAAYWKKGQAVTVLGTSRWTGGTTLAKVQPAGAKDNEKVVCWIEASLLELTDHSTCATTLVKWDPSQCDKLEYLRRQLLFCVPEVRLDRLYSLLLTDALDFHKEADCILCRQAILQVVRLGGSPKCPTFLEEAAAVRPPLLFGIAKELGRHAKNMLERRSMGFAAVCEILLVMYDLLVKPLPPTLSRWNSSPAVEGSEGKGPKKEPGLVDGVRNSLRFVDQSVRTYEKELREEAAEEKRLREEQAENAKSAGATQSPASLLWCTARIARLQIDLVKGFADEKRFKAWLQMHCETLRDLRNMQSPPLLVFRYACTVRRHQDQIYKWLELATSVVGEVFAGLISDKADDTSEAETPDKVEWTVLPSGIAAAGEANKYALEPLDAVVYMNRMPLQALPEHVLSAPDFIECFNGNVPPCFYHHPDGALHSAEFRPEHRLWIQDQSHIWIERRQRGRFKGVKGADESWELFMPRKLLGGLPQNWLRDGYQHWAAEDIRRRTVVLFFDPLMKHVAKNTAEPYEIDLLGGKGSSNLRLRNTQLCLAALVQMEPVFPVGSLSKKLAERDKQRNSAAKSKREASDDEGENSEEEDILPETWVQGEEDDKKAWPLIQDLAQRLEEGSMENVSVLTTMRSAHAGRVRLLRFLRIGQQFEVVQARGERERVQIIWLGDRNLEVSQDQSIPGRMEGADANTLSSLKQFLVLESGSRTQTQTRRVLVPHGNVKTVDGYLKIEQDGNFSPPYFLYELNKKCHRLTSPTCAGRLYLALLYAVEGRTTSSDTWTTRSSWELASELLGLSWQNRPYGQSELSLLKQLTVGLFRGSQEHLKGVNFLSEKDIKLGRKMPDIKASHLSGRGLQNHVAVWLRTVYLLVASVEIECMADAAKSDDIDASKALLGKLRPCVCSYLKTYFQKRDQVLMECKLSQEEETALLSHFNFIVEVSPQPSRIFPWPDGYWIMMLFSKQDNGIRSYGKNSVAELREILKRIKYELLLVPFMETQLSGSELRNQVVELTVTSLKDDDAKHDAMILGIYDLACSYTADDAARDQFMLALQASAALLEKSQSGFYGQQTNTTKAMAWLLLFWVASCGAGFPRLPDFAREPEKQKLSLQLRQHSPDSNATAVNVSSVRHILRAALISQHLRAFAEVPEDEEIVKSWEKHWCCPFMQSALQTKDGEELRKTSCELQLVPSPRRVRFIPLGLRGPTERVVRLSGIKFRLKGQAVPATVNDTRVGDKSGEKEFQESWKMQHGMKPIFFSFKAGQAIDGYSVVTANARMECDPIKYRMEWSCEDSGDADWRVLDAVEGDLPETRSQEHTESKVGFVAPPLSPIVAGQSWPLVKVFLLHKTPQDSTEDLWTGEWRVAALADPSVGEGEVKEKAYEACWAACARSCGLLPDALLKSLMKWIPLAAGQDPGKIVSRWRTFLRSASEASSSGRLVRLWRPAASGPGGVLTINQLEGKQLQDLGDNCGKVGETMVVSVAPSTDEAVDAMQKWLAAAMGAGLGNQLREEHRAQWEKEGAAKMRGALELALQMDPKASKHLVERLSKHVQVVAENAGIHKSLVEAADRMEALASGEAQMPNVETRLDKHIERRKAVVGKERKWHEIQDPSKHLLALHMVNITENGDLIKQAREKKRDWVPNLNNPLNASPQKSGTEDLSPRSAEKRRVVINQVVAARKNAEDKVSGQKVTCDSLATYFRKADDSCNGSKCGPEDFPLTFVEPRKARKRSQQLLGLESDDSGGEEGDKPQMGFCQFFFEELQGSHAKYKAKPVAPTWHIEKKDLRKLAQELQNRIEVIKEAADELMKSIGDAVTKDASRSMLQLRVDIFAGRAVLPGHVELISLMASFKRAGKHLPHLFTNAAAEELTEYGKTIRDSVSLYLEFQTEHCRLQQCATLLDKYAKKCEGVRAVKDAPEEAEKNTLAAKSYSLLMGQRAYNVREHPEWLVFEYECEIMVRKKQVEVVEELRNRVLGKPSILGAGDEKREVPVLQLNMGEGKSSVIMMLLILDLADGKRVVRLNILDPLVSVTLTLLAQRFSGFFAKRTYLLPIRRSRRDNRPYTASDFQMVHAQLQQVAAGGHILLMTPSQRFCFILNRRESLIHWLSSGGSGLKNDQFLDSVSQLDRIRHDVQFVDILDEADEIMRHGSELNFTVGRSEMLDGEDVRYRVCQDIFLAIFDLATQTSERKVQEGLEVTKFPPHQAAGGLSRVTFHSSEVFASYKASIAQEVWNNSSYIKEKLKGRQVEIQNEFEDVMNTLTGPDRTFDLVDFICCNLGDKQVEIEATLDENFFQSEKFRDLPAAKHIILALKAWLGHGLCAHVFSKRYRVEYGPNTVLHHSEPDKPYAVPYTGKDTPSQRSQFGHPDAELGFTILSYLYMGLTPLMLKRLHKTLTQQKGDVFAQEFFNSWLKDAHDKGFFPKGQWEKSKKYTDFNNFSEKSKSSDEWLWEACEHIGRVPGLVLYYLNTGVLAKIAQAFPKKLTADAHTLLTDRLLFDSTAPPSGMVGFSGTADCWAQMPLEVGIEKPEEEKATDGKMLDILCRKQNRVLWSEACTESNTLVDEFMRMMEKDRRINILLDPGALITDLSNAQVALRIVSGFSRICLTHALRFVVRHCCVKPPYHKAQMSIEKVAKKIRQTIAHFRNMKGCVFFDDATGVLSVMLRNGKPIPHSACIYGPDQLAVYLDDIHTRGSDLKLPLNAVGVVTLGKQMEKAKLMQAVMRLRDLDLAQSVIIMGATAIMREIQQLHTPAPEEVAMPHVLNWVTMNTMRGIDDRLFSVTQKQVSAAFDHTAVEACAHAARLCSLRQKGVSVPQACSASQTLAKLFEQVVDSRLSKCYALAPYMQSTDGAFKNMWQSYDSLLTGFYTEWTKVSSSIDTLTQCRNFITTRQDLVAKNLVKYTRKYLMLSASMDNDVDANVEKEILQEVEQEQEQERVNEFKVCTEEREKRWWLHSPYEFDALVISGETELLTGSVLVEGESLDAEVQLGWGPNIYFSRNFLFTVTPPTRNAAARKASRAQRRAMLHRATLQQCSGVNAAASQQIQDHFDKVLSQEETVVDDLEREDAKNYFALAELADQSTKLHLLKQPVKDVDGLRERAENAQVWLKALLAGHLPDKGERWAQAVLPPWAPGETEETAKSRSLAIPNTPVHADAIYDPGLRELGDDEQLRQLPLEQSCPMPQTALDWARLELHFSKLEKLHAATQILRGSHYNLRICCWRNSFVDGAEGSSPDVTLIIVAPEGFLMTLRLVPRAVAEARRRAASAAADLCRYARDSCGIDQEAWQKLNQELVQVREAGLPPKPDLFYSTPVEFVLRVQPKDSLQPKFIVLSALEASAAMERLLKCKARQTKSVLCHLDDWYASLKANISNGAITPCATAVPTSAHLEGAGKFTAAEQRLIALLRIFSGETRMTEWEMALIRKHFGFFPLEHFNEVVEKGIGEDCQSRQMKQMCQKWAMRCRGELIKNGFMHTSDSLLKKPPEVLKLDMSADRDMMAVTLDTGKMTEQVVDALRRCWTSMHPCLQKARAVKEFRAHDSLTHAVHSIISARSRTDFYFGSGLWEVVGDWITGAQKGMQPWDHWSPGIMKQRALVYKRDLQLASGGDMAQELHTYIFSEAGPQRSVSPAPQKRDTEAGVDGQPTSPKAAAEEEAAPAELSKEAAPAAAEEAKAAEPEKPTPVTPEQRAHSEKLGISLVYIMTSMKKDALRDTGMEDPTMDQWLRCTDSPFFGEKAIGKGKTCPRDGDEHCSFVDALPEGRKGVATHYLSWSYRYTVTQFTSSIEDWYEKYGDENKPPAESIFIWICLCCNNQYRLFAPKPNAAKSSTSYLLKAFETRLKHIKSVKGSMIVLLDTWNNPGYITRAWCIWEVWMAYKLKVTLEFAMPPDQRVTFRAATEKGMSFIKDAVSAVAVENAQATKEAEREMILDSIKSTTGFKAINKTVKTLLTEYMTREFAALLSEL